MTLACNAACGACDDGSRPELDSPLGRGSSAMEALPIALLKMSYLSICFKATGPPLKQSTMHALGRRACGECAIE